MNDCIIYRPYKSYVWALPFTVSVGLFAFVAAGYCILHFECTVFILAVIGIMCTWLTKILYDSSNLAMIFEQQGLRAIGCRYTDYRYVPWDELPYAYYVRSFKGHLFLVLSPNLLSPKEAKHVANRGANLSRICIGGVWVIYLDIFQNVSQIKELIDNHVVYVDAY